MSVHFIPYREDKIRADRKKIRAVDNTAQNPQNCPHGTVAETELNMVCLRKTI
jgi:hypothetical protein